MTRSSLPIAGFSTFVACLIDVSQAAPVIDSRSVSFVDPIVVHAVGEDAATAVAKQIEELSDRNATDFWASLAKDLGIDDYHHLVTGKIEALSTGTQAEFWASLAQEIGEELGEGVSTGHVSTGHDVEHDLSLVMDVPEWELDPKTGNDFDDDHILVTKVPWEHALATDPVSDLSDSPDSPDSPDLPGRKVGPSTGDDIDVKHLLVSELPGWKDGRNPHLTSDFPVWEPKEFDPRILDPWSASELNN